MTDVDQRQQEPASTSHERAHSAKPRFTREDAVAVLSLIVMCAVMAGGIARLVGLI